MAAVADPTYPRTETDPRMCNLVPRARETARRKAPPFYFPTPSAICGSQVRLRHPTSNREACDLTENHWSSVKEGVVIPHR